MAAPTFFTVITTIQLPTQSLRRSSDRTVELGGVTIAVGDKKTPDGFLLPGVRYLSLAEQLQTPWRIAKDGPTGHYSRKNVGYLEAMRGGAASIFETDDDNFPLPEWRARAEGVSARRVTERGWINVFRHFTDRRIWPRGFPLDRIAASMDGKTALEPTAVEVKAPTPRSLANTKKRIPAGSQNWETRGVLEFGQNAQLVWLMPHMHLRGKDMTFSLVNPNGRSETVLNAKFNFDWQLGYELESPIRIRRGTQMVVVAHHDNSANNPYNPDPTKEVAWGNLTSEEMVLPWFGVLVDKNVDPEKILAVRQSSCSNANSLLSTIPGVLSGPAGTPRLPIPSIPIPKGGK